MSANMLVESITSGVTSDHDSREQDIVEAQDVSQTQEIVEAQAILEPRENAELRRSLMFGSFEVKFNDVVARDYARRNME